jgi:ubiquitin-like 1-activating enzyme E1 A
LYDRQIRLWGLEAQQRYTYQSFLLLQGDAILPRMRNAKILVVGLRGIATEVIKNIVLAGIGRLIIVDGEDVSEEDLGAGFFFRNEDIGKTVSNNCANILLDRLHHFWCSGL